ncbi:MAG: YigZ family protein [Firmicutes bacterium]|nr:YigZ family protein [Bacillota bacterium]
MSYILSRIGEFELIEKKSQFLGKCGYVESAEEAIAFVNAVKSAHKEANHNVFAYSILAENIIRFNDDGEPKGTAGMPILNVFQKSDIINYVCVVTRYFGGILLGAGGLVRAYTKAAKGAMDAAAPQELLFYTTYSLSCKYSNLDKIKYTLDKLGAEVLEWQYTDICKANIRTLSTLNLFETDVSQLANLEVLDSDEVK